ncbi:MAG: methyl-accepting chemotaxis protein [Pseudomonadota bacterium]
MLSRMSILQRVALGFSGLLAVLLALSAFVWQSKLATGESFRDYVAQTERGAAVNAFVRDVTALRLGALKYRLSADEAQAAHVAELAPGVAAFAESNAELFEGGFGAGRVSEMGRGGARYAEAFQRAAGLTGERERLLAEAGEAAQAARAALERLQGEVVSRGHAESAALTGQALAELLTARLRLEQFMTSPTPGRREAVEGALETALGTTSDLIGAVSRAGLAGVAFEATGAAREFADRIAGLIPIAAEREAAFSGELDAIGPRLRSRAVDLLGELEARRARTAEGLEAAMAEDLAALGLGVAAAAAAAGLLVLVVARWIGGPVRRLAGDMQRLADGDLDLDADHGSEHDHELGRMARALAVFRDNQAALAEAEEKRRAAEARAQEERREMMRRLGRAFGEAVEAAVAGDFSARVEAEFEDADLQALARGVNRLLGSVEEGVAAAEAAMAAMADGDLTRGMQGEFEGAFGRLQESVDATVAHLRDLAERIRDGAGEISRTAGGLSAGADDLSRAAEEQAASLEETAATMEEISATVKGNADNAREAADLSRQTSETAASGREVVGGTVRLMTGIEESSTRIADITSVIDAIAFQTNLLALNAAVEAARAGEAGKGFAVVAAEVRQLAQRSSDAASDIKQLIEESGRQIAEGAETARRADRSLEEIVEAVRRLETTIGEISSASAEQSTGVEEISSTVAGLDETTQRNSQMAQSTSRGAQEATDIARRLEELAGVFRTRRDGAGARDGAAGPAAAA